MNRNAALLALFSLSLAAGALLFQRDGREEPADTPAAASCTQEASCEAAPGSGASPAGTAASRDNLRPSVSERDAASAPPPSERPPSARSPSAAAAGEALRAEADRLFAAGRSLDAIEKMREATEVHPSARNHGDLGDLLQRLTAFDEALVHLRQAAELDPGNADRWIALANAYYAAVNPGEAWTAEKRAQEAEPGLVLGRDEQGRRVRLGDSEPRKP